MADFFQAFQEWEYRFVLERVLISLFILVATAFFARTLPVALKRMLERFTKKTESKLDDRILQVVISPLGKILWLVGICFCIRQLEPPPGIATVVQGVLFTAGIVLGMFIVYRVLQVLLDFYILRAEKRDSTGLKKEFIPLVQKLLVIMVTLVGAILVLKYFGYDIFSLATAALGVGGLAIVGFAAKDMIANTIAGFTIMIDRPFRLGDRISLSDGTTGDVEEIGLRSTKIRTPDHVLVVVPNGLLSVSNIVNHAYPDRTVIGRVKIGVAYSTDLDKAKALMLDVAKSTPHVLKEPEPVVYFTDFGDSALFLEVIVWIDSYLNRQNALDALRMALKKRIEGAGVEIPYPIRTIFTRENK